MSLERTEAQKAASRLNGAKSLGPQSPEGKLISSQNAIKHGLRACTLLLPGENVEAFDELNRSLLHLYGPDNHAELSLVNIMVFCQWRQRRVWDLEQTALIQQTAAAPDPNPIHAPDGEWELPLARVTAAFEKVHGRGSGSVYQLSENRYYRQNANALHQLKLLRAARNAPLTPGAGVPLPNEPETPPSVSDPDTTPEPTPPDSAAEPQPVAQPLPLPESNAAPIVPRDHPRGLLPSPTTLLSTHPVPPPTFPNFTRAP